MALQKRNAAGHGSTFDLQFEPDNLRVLYVAEAKNIGRLLRKLNTGATSYSVLVRQSSQNPPRWTVDIVNNLGRTIFEDRTISVCYKELALKDLERVLRAKVIMQEAFDYRDMLEKDTKIQYELEVRVKNGAHPTAVITLSEKHGSEVKASKAVRKWMRRRYNSRLEKVSKESEEEEEEDDEEDENEKRSKGEYILEKANQGKKRGKTPAVYYS